MEVVNDEGQNEGTKFMGQIKAVEPKAPKEENI